MNGSTREKAGERGMGAGEQEERRRAQKAQAVNKSLMVGIYLFMLY
jgi:hypothetical protein